MSDFVNNLAGSAWAIVPVLLIFFLMAGIMFVFYYKKKMEEMTQYVKRITQALERMSGASGGEDFFGDQRK
ncbi:MAG: hypothetical protein Q4C55_10325 [Eubacterium sp.]|nr:hypothetical protein [Eubacterium sp.]